MMIRYLFAGMMIGYVVRSMLQRYWEYNKSLSEIDHCTMVCKRCYDATMGIRD